MADENLINKWKNIGNIIPTLSLNNHPNSNIDYSLVDAVNFRLSDDGMLLQLEESLKDNDVITTFLNTYLINYNIIKIYCTEYELILFVNSDNGFKFIRYNCINKTIAIFYNKYIYNNGKFSIEHFYDSNNNLILIFCEYDSDERYCPLSYINLYTFDKTIDYIDEYGNYLKENDFYDIDLSSDKLCISPAFYMSNILGVDYVNGNGILGVYEFYIRYKINENRETFWYSFGYSVDLTSNMTQTLFTNDMIDTTLDSSKYLENLDVIKKFINKTILLNFTIDSSFLEYDIGIIIYRKDEVLYKHTDWIKIKNNYIVQYKFDINKVFDIEDTFSTHNNFYNVKNIILYRNSIFISNYEIFGIKDYDTSNIKLNVIKRDVSDIKAPDYYESKKAISLKLDENIEIPIENNNLFIITLLTQYLMSNNIMDCYRYRYVENAIKNNLYIYIGFQYINGDDFGFSYDEIAINILNGKHNISFGADGSITFSTNNHIGNIIRNWGIGSNIITTPEYSYTTPAYQENNISYHRFFAISTNRATFSNPSTNLYTLNNWDLLFIISDAFYGNEPISVINPSPDLRFKTYNSIRYNFTKFSMTSGDTTKGAVTIGDPTNYENFYDTYTSAYANGSNPYSVQYKIEPYNELTNNLNLITDNYQLGYIDKTSFDYSYFINHLCDSLVVNEIYDFYIHFINKYNEISSGFRLQNNNGKFKLLDDNGEFIYNGEYFIGINYSIVEINDQNRINVLFLPIDKTIQEIYENDDIPIYLSYEFVISAGNIIFPYIDQNNTKRYVGQDKKDFIDNYFGKNIYDKIKHIYSNNFSNYSINNEFCQQYDGENRTFKVPISLFSNNQSFNIYVDNNESERYNIGLDALGLKLSNVTIPNDAIGYIITFNKFEQNNIINFLKYKLDDEGFYNDRLNLKDFSKNSLFINKINILTKDDITYYDYGKSNLLENLNVLTNHSVKTSNDTNNGRVGKSSAFVSNVNETAYPKQKTDEYEYYSVNEISNSYYNSYPILFRIGNPSYSNEVDIYDGFKGTIQRENYHIFNNNGIMYVVSIDETQSENANLVTPKFLNNEVIQSHFVLNIYELRRYSVNYINLAVKTNPLVYQNKIFVNPEDFIDLFDISILNIWEIGKNIYDKINFDNDYIFNKTIYISNPIKDEKNSYILNFDNENYKYITNSKTNIIKLDTIENILLVHGQNDLYYLDYKDNIKVDDTYLTISSSNYKNIDIKRINHENIGINNIYHSISTNKYYIFYNNVLNKLFILYSNLSIMDLSYNISYFLDMYKPKNIIFCNDIIRNRILITFYDINIKENYLTLSYNLFSMSFVSREYYYLNINDSNEYNTFLTINNINANTNSIKSFIKNEYDKSNYNNYAIGKNNDIISKLSFIINTEYPIIKFLEYFVYKSYYQNNNIEDDKEFYDIFKHSRKLIVAADYIRIFNNIVDTGWLPVDKNQLWNSKLPNNEYLYYSNIHDNRMRNNEITSIDNKNADLHSRLYGNYFIIELGFKNSLNCIEFEYLRAIYSKDTD